MMDSVFGRYGTAGHGQTEGDVQATSERRDPEANGALQNATDREPVLPGERSQTFVLVLRKDTVRRFGSRCLTTRPETPSRHEGRRVEPFHVASPEVLGGAFVLSLNPSDVLAK